MSSKTPLVPRKLIFPFILVTTLFFAWGFANDITNPMVKAFSKIFRMSVTDGALVQLAFYGGYFVMAFPAALFIRKYSYKAGILLGLTLYGAGALLFIPASITGYYYPFLIAYFILTCGSETGNARAKTARFCKEKGFIYKGLLEVVMPENYVALFSVPEEHECRRLTENAAHLLKESAKYIRVVLKISCSNTTQHHF